MPLTRESIISAAETLVAQGQSPTLAAVRRAVGGGSFTTISEFMAEWRSQRQIAEARENAPKPVADRLQDLGNEIWAAAVELAQGRLAAERSAVEAQRTELERRQAEAAELTDQMAEEIDTLKARWADTEEKHAAQVARLETERELAKQQAGEAREAAAALRGQLEALAEQNKALLAKIGPAAGDTAPPKAKTKRLKA